MRKQFVTCAKCGKVAKTDSTVIPHEVGTQKCMRCPDCAGEDGKASMCRACCPTGHGTRFEGTEGQDRESYSDDQDRENYS